MSVKDPNVKDNSGNPRAANMPREKKAHVSRAERRAGRWGRPVREV